MRKKKFNFGLLCKHKAQEENFQKRSDIKGNATELYEYKKVRFARAPINLFSRGRYISLTSPKHREILKIRSLCNLLHTAKMFTTRILKYLLVN